MTQQQMLDKYVKRMRELKQAFTEAEAKGQSLVDNMVQYDTLLEIVWDYINVTPGLDLTEWYDL